MDLLLIDFKRYCHEAKEHFARLADQRRFDYIALLLGLIIQETCPFRTKEAYNDILIGAAGADIKHKGFLGWAVFDRLPEKEMGIDDLKQPILKTPYVLYPRRRLQSKYHYKPLWCEMDTFLELLIQEVALCNQIVAGLPIVQSALLPHGSIA
jgi:hypothetical protein